MLPAIEPPRTGVLGRRKARTSLGRRQEIGRNPVRAAQVEALAQCIAELQSSTDLVALASQIAEDQIDLVRVRQIRRDLIESYWTQTDERQVSQLAQRIEVLDRYERRSMSRRNCAIQTFNTVIVLKSCIASHECT